MKRFFNGGILDVLFVTTIVVLLGSVIFTTLTGESPLEALGISPEAATVGTIAIVVVLVTFPIVLRLFGKKASDE